MPNCEPCLVKNIFKKIKFMKGYSIGWEWVAVYRSKGKGRGKRIKWKRVK